MSKAYAMSGWRIGYAAGPNDLIRAMSVVQSQSTTNASSIGQAAAAAALNGDQSCVREFCEVFRTRHDAIQPQIDAIDGIRCLPGEGAFYLFPDVSEALERKGVPDDVAFCERLLDATGVALVPGTAFGAPGFVRISFAAGLHTLEAAVERIRHFVNN